MSGSVSAIQSKIQEPRGFPLLGLGRIFSPRALSVLRSPLFQIAILFLIYGVILNRVFAFERSIVGHIGFAMDDAWIHSAVARNFIDGLGFGIVPHRPLSVSTSPTWTLALAAFYLVFSNPVHGTIALSVVCLLGTIASLYLTIRALTGKGWLAMLGTVLFLLNPLVIWGMAAGMESPLSLFSLALVFYLYYCFDPETRVRQWAVPAALAFAGMTRPELFILTPLALLDTLLSLRAQSLKTGGRGQGWIDPIKAVFIQGIVILAILSPYFIFNLRYGGHLFPTTFYAKTLVRGVGLSAAIQSGEWKNIMHAAIANPRAQVTEIIASLLDANLVCFLLVFPGMMYFLRPLANSGTSRGWLLAIAILVIPWTMGMSSPARYFANYADRYYVIFPPMAILLGMTGLSFIIDYGKLRVLPVLMVLLMAVAPWRTTLRAVQLLSYGVDSTERLYREMGIWMRENIPATAVLATNDIGGLAYFARRDFIDVMGLSSPEIWPVLQRGYGQKQDLQKLLAYLRSQKVEYVLLSPKYYPELTNRKDIFEPVMQWSERYQHGRLISPQILYKLH